MKNLLKYVSFILLVLMLLSTIIYFTDGIAQERNNQIILALTIGWFILTPFWMLKSEQK